MTWSWLRDDRHDSEGTRRGQPEVRYALVGAAFGLLLIYLGIGISARILRWPVLVLGLVFVVVMTAYMVELAWKKIASRVRPVVARRRGHVRDDPQLGTLTRDLRTRFWMSTLTIDNRSVDLAIAGDDEPSPALLARARELVADLDSFERRLRDYLVSEAREWTLESPELVPEIRALQLSGIVLRSPERPGQIVLDFRGPDEMRFWYCDYVDGRPSGLRFDT